MGPLTALLLTLNEIKSRHRTSLPRAAGNFACYLQQGRRGSLPFKRIERVWGRPFESQGLGGTFILGLAAAVFRTANQEWEGRAGPAPKGDGGVRGRGLMGVVIGVPGSAKPGSDPRREGGRPRWLRPDQAKGCSNKQGAPAATPHQPMKHQAQKGDFRKAHSAEKPRMGASLARPPRKQRGLVPPRALFCSQPEISFGKILCWIAGRFGRGPLRQFRTGRAAAQAL